jgi:hypothetical protein
VNTVCKIIFSAFWLAPVVILVYGVTKAYDALPDSNIPLAMGISAIIATSISSIKTVEIWSGKRE